MSEVSASDLMRWQEQMSNTSHQREVADLKAAGLNPVLSAKYGGASVPSGAVDSGLGSAISSGSGGGLISGSGGRDGFLGGLIDSLPDNGVFRIGKISIPYKTIKYLYDAGSNAVGSLAESVNGIFGTSLSEASLIGLLQNKAETEGTVGINVNHVTPSAKSEMEIARLGLDAGSNGFVSVNGNGNSAYRAAQSKYEKTRTEEILGAINPRLLDMYWHIKGDDWKRKASETDSRR